MNGRCVVGLLGLAWALVGSAASASPGFDPRLEALDRAVAAAEHDRVLTLAGAIEATEGRSVRVQSAKVLALVGRSRGVDAYDALLDYFAMVDSRGDLASDLTHQHLVALRPALQAEARAALQRRKAELAAARKTSADRAVASLTVTPAHRSASALELRAGQFNRRQSVADTINTAHREAAGHVVDHGGTPHLLVFADESFGFAGARAWLETGFVPVGGGPVRTEVLAGNFDFTKVLSIESSDPGPDCGTPTAPCAGTVVVTLMSPAIEATSDGSGAGGPVATSRATFHFSDAMSGRGVYRALHDAVATAVEDPAAQQALSGADAERLGGLLVKNIPAYLWPHSVGMSVLRTAASQGRLTRPLLIADALGDEGEPEAEDWYRKALDGGAPGAAERYAVYLERMQRPRDARRLWERVAADGNADAELAVARLYMDEDHFAAERWARKAMDHGAETPEFWERLQARLTRLRYLQALPLDRRVAAWTPVGLESFLGRRLAQIEDELALQATTTARTRSGLGTNRVFRPAARGKGRPSRLLVNRGGAVVGETLRVADGADPAAAAAAYDRVVFDLREVFGTHQLTVPSDLGPKLSGTELMGEHSRTIRVTRGPSDSEWQDVDLTIIDHQRERVDLRRTHVEGGVPVGAVLMTRYGEAGPGLRSGMDLVLVTQASGRLWVGFGLSSSVGIYNTGTVRVQDLEPGEIGPMVVTTAGPELRFGARGEPVAGVAGGLGHMVGIVDRSQVAPMGVWAALVTFPTNSLMVRLVAERFGGGLTSWATVFVFAPDGR